MADRRKSIVWSADARADIALIWHYYADSAGPHTADNIVSEIADACRLIEEHPLGGRMRDEVRPGLRSVFVHPHVVFYRITEDTPQVVRVLDTRRDLDQIFTAGFGDR